MSEDLTELDFLISRVADYERTLGIRDGLDMAKVELRRLSGEEFSKGNDGRAKDFRDLAKKLDILYPDTSIPNSCWEKLGIYLKTMDDE